MSKSNNFKPAKLNIPIQGKGDWYAYYYYRHPLTGKFVLFKERKGINRQKSKADKKRFGNDLVAELNDILRGGWSPFSRSKELLPIIDVLEDLNKIKENSLRRRTWQSYKYSIDVFTKFLNEFGYEQLTPVEFDINIALQFTDWLQSKKKFKGKSFNSCKNNIGTFFNMMVDREIIDKNPFSKIRNQKEEMGKNIALTDVQKKKLSKYLVENNYRLYLFTQFIYFCYIRPLELLRLRVSNVDLKHRTITIYGSQSKNRNTEVVVIPDAFIPLVAEMNLEDYPADHYLFGYQLQTSARSYSRNQVTKRHTAALDKLEMLKEFTMYSWKHTGVVNAYKAGIDIYSIMRQCRHSSINQTQRYLKSLGLMPNTEFASKMK